MPLEDGERGVLQGSDLGWLQQVVEMRAHGEFDLLLEVQHRRRRGLGTSRSAANLAPGRSAPLAHHPCILIHYFPSALSDSPSRTSPGSGREFECIRDLGESC